MTSILLSVMLGLAFYSAAQASDLVQICAELSEGQDSAQELVELCELQSAIIQMQMTLDEITGGSEDAPVGTPAKRKNEFIRFGKRKNEFIRFGKRKNEFIRFGKRKFRFGKRMTPALFQSGLGKKSALYQTGLGKRKNEFIRFGKRKNEFIRFGKRKNEFIRFGKKSMGPEHHEGH